MTRIRRGILPEQGYIQHPHHQPPNWIVCPKSRFFRSGLRSRRFIVSVSQLSDEMLPNSMIPLRSGWNKA